MIDRLDALYRRTGANLPHGDPLPSHGAQMEGYFWRVTDVASSRVIVVLCGINRHPDGDWATVAIAAEPGGFVRSAAFARACSRRDSFVVTAGDGGFRATSTDVHLDLGDDAVVDISIDSVVGWPHALGGGGFFSAVPFLVRVGDDVVRFATVVDRAQFDRRNPVGSQRTRSSMQPSPRRGRSRRPPRAPGPAPCGTPQRRHRLRVPRCSHDH